MIGPNNAFEEELYFQYLQDPDSVSKEWQEYFKKIHGKSAFVVKNQAKSNTESKPEPLDQPEDEIKLKSYESLEPLSPIPAKISVNMEESLTVPTATSVRTMPVKALDENRRIINKYLLKMKRPKVSFTHIILWAIVKGLIKYPRLNDAFVRKDGKPFRIRRKSINAGLAVDVEKKDGSRLLLVPNVKNAQDLNFSEFIEAFNDIINKSRNNKLDISDLMDTTVTLTNPGMIGTSFSNPRLMKGQGMIIASGTINYPPELQAVRPDMLTNLAVSKVVTMTNTYDHRIIQGAESAEFLAYVNKLLIGEKHFYDQIFAALKIPFEPIRWTVDKYSSAKPGTFVNDDMIEKGAHAMLMINAYRVRGHLLASINPLGQESYYYPELDPAYYGFTIWDLDRQFHADDSWQKNNLPLREIIETVRETYCGPIGVEFMHIQTPDKKEWIKRYLEGSKNTRIFSNDEKIEIYNKLAEAESFENFLHTKYVGHKRFSLEGSESIIVLLDEIFRNAAEKELNSVVLGMAHRGRLNVLVNNIGKDMKQVFDEFDDDIDTTLYSGSGDVKYHLGASGRYKTKKDKKIDVLLAPNPSHLELVNPVVEGMARALNNKIEDKNHKNNLPVLIHGDAAFAGQGIVAETLNLSQLDGYKTGGTIHIIINNQIGFTTTVESSRSSVYATDIAKMIQVPIIHVNGFEPESVIAAAEFAFLYREKFGSDVILDILSFRKYGHNEADEPAYTQPLLYKKIKSMAGVRQKYEKELIAEKVLNNDRIKEVTGKIKAGLEDAYKSRKKGKAADNKELVKYNSGDIFKPVKTSVKENLIEEITQTLTTVPVGFKAHKKVLSLLKKRASMIEPKVNSIDWAMAELLAFGTILTEGRDIRFSGEDTRRGTFSQRHAALFDTMTEEMYIPLNKIRDEQGVLRIYDSPLSEMGVLGFEYGYSVVKPQALTLWEAQFGDFANMAQPIVDQFLSCAETKWNQVSNMVMLLPHSYDGQGPEHSSARLERHLQTCADENMIVCNLSTPAQYFHLLRRQVNAEWRKPLILMTPKSMLRTATAVSPVEEFISGGFKTIIDEGNPEPEKTRKVLLCTGKIYHDIIEYINAKEINDVAIVRVEQLYPFDEKVMKSIIRKYSKVSEFVWVQEEPINMGAWYYIMPRLSGLLLKRHKLNVSARKESASTATGSYTKHVIEQRELLEKAFE